MSASSTKARPSKPYSGFPLHAHGNGQWAAKIRGRKYYFGPWADWKAALARYKAESDDLKAGRTPRTTPDGGLRVHDVVNRFLAAKRQALETRELKERTFAEYLATGKRLVAAFGRDRLVADLRPDDFAALRDDMAARAGLVRLGNLVQQVRTVFRHAYEAGDIEVPIRFGPQFHKPSRKSVRGERQGKPPKFIDAPEIRALLGVADPPLRAMILLGANAGFANTDIATLPRDALDLDNGILHYPRPKTQVERWATLWPETVSALKEAIAVRPAAKAPEDDRLVFLTKYGRPWVRQPRFGAGKEAENAGSDALGPRFAKLQAQLGIKKSGVNFGSLRHAFATVAGECRDQPTVDRIMGHASEGIAANYREWLRDARELQRFRKVTDHVRGWLFDSPQG